jgi:hypothetical protein
MKYLLQYSNPLLALLIVASILTFVAYGIQVLIFPQCEKSTFKDRCELVHAFQLLSVLITAHIESVWIVHRITVSVC